MEASGVEASSSKSSFAWSNFPELKRPTAREKTVKSLVRRLPSAPSDLFPPSSVFRMSAFARAYQNTRAGRKLLGGARQIAHCHCHKLREIYDVDAFPVKNASG